MALARQRIGLILLPLLLVAISIIDLIIVRKVVAIGGPAYRWEYFPPTALLVAGIYLVAHRAWRLTKG